MMTPHSVHEEKPRRQLSYDQQRLLSLLKEGGDEAWNVAVAVIKEQQLEACFNFEDIDFSDPVDFTDCRFPVATRFYGATFESDACFDDALFESDAFFRDATFKGRAVFDRATFKGEVFFDGVTFKGKSEFNRTAFESDAFFRDATFKGRAVFDRATFKGEVFFDSVTFKGNAWFSNATFKSYAKFNDAAFKGMAVFQSAAFESAFFWRAAFKGEVSFDNATFKRDVRFGGVTFKGKVRFGGVTVERSAWFIDSTFRNSALFDHTTFKSYARFNDAKFKGKASFARVKFKGMASFRGATMGRFNLTAASFTHIPDFRDIPDISLLRVDDARFRLATVQDYPARFAQWASGISASDTVTISKIRCLRGIAANTHNVDVERDLHILERSAELGSNWSIWWKGQSRPIRRAWRWWNAESTPEGEESTSVLLLTKTLLGSVSIVLFRWSSYCGRSAFLPAIWLLVATLCFYGLYSVHYDAQSDPLLPLGEIRSEVLRAFTLANALPFGSAARPAYATSMEMLFGKGALLPLGFQMLSLLQGLTTVVLLFLVGLGLRNFFRMK